MLSLVAGIKIENEPKKNMLVPPPNDVFKAAAAEEEEIEITGGEFEDGACSPPSLPQQVKHSKLNNHL